MKRITLALLGFLAACGGKTLALDSPKTTEAGITADPYAAECAGSAVPPSTLKCTGLYSDIANKVIADGVRPYAPAVPLWADFATKQRWILLPPGMKIDATDPNEWTFPVGTKVWKEFSRDGKRVETRLFQKVETGFWARTTYAWNADDTDATVSAGGDMPWGTDGGIYHIPTPDECDQCHRGRSDRLLGFEQVSLGLDAATGLTLPQLVSEGLISPAPALTSLTVGDDGTGLASAPLEWLHINCGVTCHNDNANSTAYGSSMRLRLDPTQLDGRSSADFPSRVTTLDVLANTPAWLGLTRVEPGNPTHSLLVELISNRGTDNPVGNQMPPIATRIVDTTDAQNVIDWIGKMPEPPSDAGPEASTTHDAGRDATVGDDAGPDAAPVSEASVDGGVDATLQDASDATDDSADDDEDEADAGDGGSSTATED
ncbi:MAG TPA: hypothetical protein VK762_36880 [Polyangiaceae bacterium]|nr:hypothetical protein [Polyangiaceae bacterium]